MISTSKKQQQQKSIKSLKYDSHVVDIPVVLFVFLFKIKKVAKVEGQCLNDAISKLQIFFHNNILL